MNWRHRIAVVVLLVLVGLPLAGTICAMTCVPASTAGAAAVATHHGDGQGCEQAMPVSSADNATAGAAKVGALADFDCGHHEGTIPQVAATVAQRADLAVIAAPAASDPVHPLFGRLTPFDLPFRYSAPPDSAPPTATPVVLRV